MMNNKRRVQIILSLLIVIVVGCQQKFDIEGTWLDSNDREYVFENGSVNAALFGFYDGGPGAEYKLSEEPSEKNIYTLTAEHITGGKVVYQVEVLDNDEITIELVNDNGYFAPGYRSLVRKPAYSTFSTKDKEDNIGQFSRESEVVIKSSELIPNNVGDDLDKYNSEQSGEVIEEIESDENYFTDVAGWIENNAKINEGLSYFHKETGVHPHVYITDYIMDANIQNVDSVGEFASNLYDELFTDENHLLLVFYEPLPSKYVMYYITGTEAKQVIDEKARNILLDYLEQNYYDDNLSDEQFFSDSFQQTADSVMKNN